MDNKFWSWETWEKRDWGGGQPMWRPILQLSSRYPRNSVGPSHYAMRRIPNRIAKRRQLMVSLWPESNAGILAKFIHRQRERERQRKRAERAKKRASQ